MSDVSVNKGRLWFSVGTVAAIVMFAVGAYAALDRQLDSREARQSEAMAKQKEALGASLSDLSDDVEALGDGWGEVSSAVNRNTETIQQLADDHYTTAAAAENALREAIENPGHRVPDPRNPGEVFVVEVSP